MNYLDSTPVEQLDALREMDLASFRAVAERLLAHNLPLADRVANLNALRRVLHELSPFCAQPVDLVEWIAQDDVQANDYNPNAVAPPEMELLYRSISADGYTQPIVAASEESGERVVVDGFHRNRVGREYPDIRDQLAGYLPVVEIRTSQRERGDRIAATIRHNRARGKHRIDAMSDIVIELKRRNWTDEKIGRELGMDRDEVLRLCQITGLAELFSDQDFSRAWDVEGHISEDDFEDLTDDVEEGLSRTVNTSDPDRIFHPHHLWECYAAGFYAPTKHGVSKAQGEEMYRAFLSDLPRFRDALEHVTSNWKHSCEHYLTNRAMNRIAWLGQAAMCQATGIPASYRAGFGLLTLEQQNSANELALEYLNRWLAKNGRRPVEMDEAMSYERQSDIY